MLVEQVSERRFPPGLSVSPCSAGPRLVVVIGGEATWTTADHLRETLAAAIAYGPRSMVLDLTDLAFCSVEGLRALMAAVDTAEAAGADVTLHGMSRQLTWMHDLYQERRRNFVQQTRRAVHGPRASQDSARSVPTA